MWSITTTIYNFFDFIFSFFLSNFNLDILIFSIESVSTNKFYLNIANNSSSICFFNNFYEYFNNLYFFVILQIFVNLLLIYTFFINFWIDSLFKSFSINSFRTTYLFSSFNRLNKKVKLFF